MRIEKHNIEIRKLKLDVAQQKYQHMKRSATLVESTTGQRVIAGGSTTNYKQQHTPGKANKHSKKNGKETKSKKPAGMSSAVPWKGKGRKDSTSPKAHKITDASSAKLKKSAPSRAQTAGGSENPKPADERHQGDSSEQHPPQNPHFEAGEGDVSAEQALLSQTMDDTPDSDDASPTNKELSNNSKDQTQPPLVNGHTSPAGSATKISSKPNLKRRDLANSVYVDKTEPADVNEGEAGSSTSRIEQSPLDGHDKPAGPSEVGEVVSLTQSNAASDGNPISSSTSDNESSSVISVEYFGGDGDEAPASPSVEESDKPPIHRNTSPEQSNGDYNDQPGNPRPSLSRPNSTGQPKQGPGCHNGVNQEISDAPNDVEFHTFTFSKIKKWLRKARPGGTRKDENRRGRARKASLR